jgi:hypothetical protein
MLVASLVSAALPILFVASGTFAMFVIWECWRGFGAQFRRLQAQLQVTEEYREFSIQLTTAVARPSLPRMRFSIRPRGAAYRSDRKPALRAAA